MESVIDSCPERGKLLSFIKGGNVRELIRKLMGKTEENEVDESDFWQPGGWTDDRSHWEQYDEMPWNG